MKKIIFSEFSNDETLEIESVILRLNLIRKINWAECILYMQGILTSHFAVLRYTIIIIFQNEIYKSKIDHSISF